LDLKFINVSNKDKEEIFFLLLGNKPTEISVKEPTDLFAYERLGLKDSENKLTVAEMRMSQWTISHANNIRNNSMRKLLL
jgi:hypothetical protein